MKRLEAILSRDSLETVTGLLIEHGCGEISLFKVDGAKPSELADPSPSAHATDYPWIRLEAVVGDAEALPTMHAILDASHRPAGRDDGLIDETESVSSIAIWNVEPARSGPVAHRV
jgi:hypothetical protein